MTAAEFVEQVLDIELSPYLKDFANKYYEAASEGKILLYYPPRGCSKNTMQYIEALVIVMVGQDKGIIKKEIIRKDNNTKRRCICYDCIHNINKDELACIWCGDGGVSNFEPINKEDKND